MTNRKPNIMDTLRQLESITNAAPPKESGGLSLELAKTLQRIRELESKLAIATARPLAIPAKAPSTPAKAVSRSPLSDQLAKLTGASKTVFYRANAAALRSEQIVSQFPDTITPNTKKA